MGTVTLIAVDKKTLKANMVRFKDILEKRDGKSVRFLEKCNEGFLIQCDHSAMGASSPIKIPLIIVILICIMLVFGVLFLLKKNRALQRELKTEKGGSENLTVGTD
jgi:hypothetical protein